MDKGDLDKLDFLIVGAQKSGTTTLFKLIENHPGIYVPPAKEIPFFSDDENYKKGYQWYVDNFFSSAGEKTLKGTVTPHYLYDPEAPARIFSHNNRIKIVAVLRNPIDRAESHYKMSVRRGLEQRSLSKVIDFLITPEQLKVSRGMRSGKSSETMGYITRGEYFRQLKVYFDLFPEENIKVYFMEDLENQPQVVLDDLCGFLCVDAYKSPLTGEKFHQGGLKEKLPLRRISRIKIIRFLWGLLSPNQRSKISYWMHQRNTVVDSTSMFKESDRAKLAAHYRKDVGLLRSLLGKSPPWKEFK